MKTLFLATAILCLASCQREQRVIQYKPFAPRDMMELITNDIRHYKTAITSLRGNEAWRYYVTQFPDDLYNNRKYSFSFFPGMGQGGPFMYLLIRFNTAKEAQDYYLQHSKGFVLQFEDIAAIKNSEYCFPQVEHSNYQDYDSFRFMDSSRCSGNGDIENIGGIASGIALSKKRHSVYCWAEDDRL